MPICNGCVCSFTESGYSRHLAQTRNTSCISIYEEMYNYMPSHSQEENLDVVDDMNLHGNSNHEFEGDYFNTMPGDLQWPEDDKAIAEEDEEEVADETWVVEQEANWEPPIQVTKEPAINLNDENIPMDEDNTVAHLEQRTRRHEAELPLHEGPYITKFPLHSAGAIINTESDDADTFMQLEHGYQSYRGKIDGNSTVWAPFTSRINYEICDKLDLSYQNSRDLNKIIDSKIPAYRPRFQQQDILVAGEAFDVYFRDIIECVKALYGDPELVPYLMFAPEQHYSDKDKTQHVYHDMHTGQWWWHTQILLGYLPTTKLEHITNKAARRRCLANLFHACMRHIVTPLVEPGKHGMSIASGDGALRRGHPLVACYIGDYPEQLLVTGMKTGECPKCDIPSSELGSKDLPFELRNMDEILNTLALADDDLIQFAKACHDAGVKPLYYPFWEELPHCNIFNAIMLDILHQLYQGLVKHMISWLKSACISVLSRVSGTEHQQICRFLLGITSDICLPDGIRSSFNLPKLHSFRHYVTMIQIFGTTDNYNTEYTEQLHIDLAKDAYSKLAKHPAVKCVTFTSLVHDYGAVHFQAAMARFIVQVMQPDLTARQSEDATCNVILPFQSVSVFHKVRRVPARFDTALVNLGNGGKLGVEGYHVAQVLVIFSLSVNVGHALFHNDNVPDQLAYVEWFTPFSAIPDINHGMYRVSHAFEDGDRQASVIPIRNI
ncbi:hypothetical protein BDR07DRAFT_1453416 [Suillus spraguei]|nr:hypothetical protein BDR07DRAFT_1453416 [Suillus spraguei]